MLRGNDTVPYYSRVSSLAIDFYSNGQKPNSISYRTTPKDQISALIVYTSPFRISGAM